MSPEEVLVQFREMFSRVISSNLSVKQFVPSDRRGPNGVRTIGDLPSTIALKDVAYSNIYADIDSHDAYHIKLPDGGLVAFQYIFDKNEVLTKHRLAFFPCSILPTAEEAPELYEKDELFGDILVNRIVRFPIRLDYDPENHSDVRHPKCHLTLGQFDNCRIPVAGPVMPYQFLLFIIRNFYHRIYIHNRNCFDKKIPFAQVDLTITTAEKRISHFVMGTHSR